MWKFDCQIGILRYQKWALGKNKEIVQLKIYFQIKAI